MEFTLGRFLLLFRWLIVIAWIVVTCICLAVLSVTSKPFKVGGNANPHVESSIANNIMTDKLSYGGSRIYILYNSKRMYVNDRRFETEVKQSLDGLKHLSLKYRILSPYQHPQQISDDQHAAYAVVIFDKDAGEAANEMNLLRQSLGKPASITMLIGGEPSYISNVIDLSEKDLFRAELIAIALSSIALIFIFSGIVAASIPVITGIINITIIITLLYLLGHIFEISVFALNIASMLGLGLSLDYALLMTNRFREELNKDHDKTKAMYIMLGSAGKAILFSGMTVFISLAALLFFPINLLFSIGMGGVIAVIVSILSALFFVPAFLYLLGDRVNALTIPFLRKGLSLEHAHNSFWYHIANYIMHRPFLFMIPTIIFLLVLGYPFLHVKINSPDPNILPAWTESRRFLEEFEKKFGGNDLSPIYVVLKSSNKSILTDKNIASIYTFTHHLAKDKRIKHIESIVTIKPDLTIANYQRMYNHPSGIRDPTLKDFVDQNAKGQYTVITIISKHGDNEDPTLNLVKSIRKTHIGNHIQVYVGGRSAGIIDTIHSVYTLFAKLIIIISLITYIVLMTLLRSVILPLKAIIMNLLSLFVCYGMLVFIYQDGHLAHLLHFDPQGFTDINLPIILFCGLFGLSMDYEVFLLTRIREFYDSTTDNNLSVALGLERSARVITGAALMMVIVSFSFVTANVVFIKAFGLGMGLAVIIDATIIRMLLVPATMCLLGKWNWYLPSWLDRIIPHLKIE